MRLNWGKDQTRQGHFFVYWGPVQTNKAGFFTKHHPPSHHTAMRHEYLHKYNHSLSFVPPRGCITHILVLTSPGMSNEPRVPKLNCQEPRGSTSDCLTLVPKETFQKSNRQEPVGSTSERITFLLKKIHHE